jgi:hypothetical protein
MKVKLPVGTIGIRGTIALGQVSAEGSTAILLGPGSHGNTDDAPGAITFENNGTTRLISEPGKGVTCQAGQSPSSVQDLTAIANTLNALLENPTDPKAQNTGGGGGSATNQSGQGTAAAKRSSSDAAAVDDALDNQSAALTKATQDAANLGINDGPATWEQVLANVQTGTGFFFSGHAPISCSGACINLSSPNNPLGAVQLFVDFGARTVGGATAFLGPSGISGSFIHIHNIYSSGDTTQQLIGGGGSGLNPISFASLSGPASITLQTGVNTASITTGSSPFFASGNFNGSTISLVNAGGVAAATAQVNLTYSGTNTSLSSVGASGTFPAPR